MKRIFIFVLSLLLIFAFVAPTYANSMEMESSLSDNNFYHFNSAVEFSEEELNSILEASDLMDTFIITTGDKVAIDENARSVVGDLVYNQYLSGVEVMNSLIDEKIISVANREVKQLMTVDEILNNPKFNPDIITLPKDPTYETNSSTKKYWWGVKWYLNKSEADKLERKFDDLSFDMATWAAIFAIVGTFMPWFLVASVASLIVSVGASKLYRAIRDGKGKNGVIVTFDWSKVRIYGTPR